MRETIPFGVTAQRPPAKERRRGIVALLMVSAVHTAVLAAGAFAYEEPRSGINQPEAIFVSLAQAAPLPDPGAAAAMPSPPPEPAEEAEPESKPEPKPTKTAATEVAEVAEAPTQTQPAEVPSAPGGAGGDPAAVQDYLATLSAYLEQHKQYPRRAYLRRQEGVAELRFVVDRSGRVLSYRIIKSSGHDALDAEVRRMIERASPLPAMPASMKGATLELVLPVSFYLR